VRREDVQRLEKCRHALRDAKVRTAGSVAFFVPGRIEVLGKHTDYLGGRSLLAAVERGFILVGVPLAEPELLAIDAATGESVRFPLSTELETAPGHWSNYVRTVARRLMRDFPGAPGGCAISFHSNLPPAAGLSSSSALVVGTMLILASVLRLDRRPEYGGLLPHPHDLAQYAAAVESGAGFRSLPGDRGVGTHGGSEDHTAILCAKAGRLVSYSFSPFGWNFDVELPAGYRFAIAASGVLAEKTGTALARYNRLSAVGRRLLTLWNEETGRVDASLDAALDSDAGAADRLRALIAAASPDDDRAALLARLDQFVAESREMVVAAANALAQERLAEFGEIVDRSQALATSHLMNQIPETVDLARSARELGAVAASAFGAGFGGSVWALVAEPTAYDFLAAWRDRYRASYPEHDRAEFFLTAAGPPARRVRYARAERAYYLQELP
jgi:galactokinase